MSISIQVEYFEQMVSHSFFRMAMLFGFGSQLFVSGVSRQSNTYIRCSYMTMRVGKGKMEQMKSGFGAPQFRTSKVVPKNLHQSEYVENLRNTDMGICVGAGSPGTGKTLFACNVGAEMLDRKMIDRIIITRPLVTVCNEEIGFLPGTLNKKMDPWMLPIMDIFEEYYSKKEVARMVQSGILEVVPLGFMRWRTFKRSWIIADELQNATKEQVMMLLTRIGDESKMIITGDLSQSDLGLDNGLADLLYRLTSRHEMVKDKISVVQFTKEDVERSPIVKLVLDLYLPYTS